MSEISDVEKQDYDRVVEWALGQNRFNGARSELRELAELVGKPSPNGREGTGLVGKMIDMQEIIEKMDERDKRMRYISIGLMSGVLIVLVIFAWQGNQQAQSVLELIQEIKRVVP